MPVDHIKSITHQIRKKREELQYSQEYMAAKMHMGQNCYSKIELGLSKLTVERLIAICQLLDMSAGHLLDEARAGEYLFTIYKQEA